MSFLNNSSKSRKEEETVSLGVIDPALDKFYKRVEGTPDATRKSIGFSVIGAVIVASAVFAFISLPNFVHVAVGVPLAVALFGVGLSFVHLRNLKKKAQDPSYLTFKERNSPNQRMRYGITGLVGFLILSLTIKDFVPYIFGGILSVNAVMAAYNYIRRTPDELERDAKGETDPRDIAEEAEELEEAEPVVSDKETEEYITLVNSLPEEQRKILLNPKLNGALTVIDDDDIKSKKKRKLFGK